jgi:hypothetical protein
MFSQNFKPVDVKTTFEDVFKDILRKIMVFKRFKDIENNPHIQTQVALCI